MPHRYSVGDRARITERTLQIMRAANAWRIRIDWLSDDFLKLAEENAGVVGTVTHTFPPGYEVTFEVGEKLLHMKDHYLEPVDPAPDTDAVQ